MGDRGEAGRRAAQERGWRSSKPVWRKEIKQAMIERDIPFSAFEGIWKKVLTDAFSGDMHLGYSTIGSYIGLLQAKGELPGVTNKFTDGTIDHYERLNLTDNPKPDTFDPSWVWGSRPSSSDGLRKVTKFYRGRKR